MIHLHPELYKAPSSIVYNEPWQTTTKNIPDKYFDFVVDDVPYGINVGGMQFLKEKETIVKQKNGQKIRSRKKRGFKLKDWDLIPPDQSYFDEMVRISKNQIIFGVEYVEWKNVGSGRIKWNKGVAKGMSFKDYELAYCSCIDYVHEIDYLWSGMMQGKSISDPMTQQGNKKLNEVRIHPCHKPILLYKKIALDFNLKNKKVYCGHNGSGSDRIAFYNYVSQFIASETDLDYFNNQEKRFNNFISQQSLNLF